MSATSSDNGVYNGMPSCIVRLGLGKAHIPEMSVICSSVLACEFEREQFAVWIGLELTVNLKSKNGL